MIVCSKCESSGTRLYSSFGKLICKPCLDARKKTGRKGNSGMVYNPDVSEKDYIDPSRAGVHLSLLKVKKSNPLYVKWYIEHYPESKGIVGRQLNYLIYKNELPIGIIGFASPPLNYGKFNDFFCLDSGDVHSENAKLFLNNNAFRIVHTEKNIGTQILKIARKMVWEDYQKVYACLPLGLVTFVEPPRDGALYKADNWIFIGETKGVEVKRRGEEWTEKQYSKGIKKLIYGYKYDWNIRRRNTQESHSGFAQSGL